MKRYYHIVATLRGEKTRFVLSRRYDFVPRGVPVHDGVLYFTNKKAAERQAAGYRAVVRKMKGSERITNAFVRAGTWKESV